MFENVSASDSCESEVVDGILIVRLLRKFNVDEISELIDAVASNQDFTRRLWDVTDNFDLNMDELNQIAVRGRSSWPGSSRVAYVAEDDLGYGLCRMFEAFRGQTNYKAKVFRSQPEAMAWLKQWEGQGTQPARL